jgi:hypothetical protein
VADKPSEQAASWFLTGGWWILHLTSSIHTQTGRTPYRPVASRDRRVWYTAVELDPRTATDVVGLRLVAEATTHVDAQKRR